MIEQYRDVRLWEIAPQEYQVLACDTIASIGQKPADSLPTPPEIVGSFATRGVLFEILCVGGQPQILVSLSGNEWESTSRLYHQGIQAELVKAGQSQVQITGSTEENMTTSMSCLGATLLGKVDQARLRVRQVQTGDQVYQLGKPYVGQDVLTFQSEIINYQNLYELLAYPIDQIPELVPIGSKGALNECQQVAQFNQLSFRPSQKIPRPDLAKQSAGPSTSLLVVIRGDLAPILDSYPWYQYLGEYEDA